MRLPSPTGSHVFQRTGNIFEHNSLFTCFHYIHKKKTLPAYWRPYFSPIWTIFELVRDINKTNVLTKFRDSWLKLVTSRPNKKTAPPTGGHVFQRTGTTFQLDQYSIKTNILKNFELHRGIIRTNLLTKFHEDRKRNVASRVFTNQMWTTDGRRTKTVPNSSSEQSVVIVTFTRRFEPIL
ncbi:hypothetical protein DPMN_123355 [Dreissena polymorpha]|uniref:Uncharacterized protein n=1 Tax=Dreissena polymorpha TaxID=45954 RepID=A0A9D4GUA4_DREPO|nr:hypothetical protein DPMN_123355 [Dreissena polymorpha]